MDDKSERREAMVPPSHFSLVCAGVYRSNVPLPVNAAFLRALELRHVVFLSAEEQNKTMRQLVSDSGGATRFSNLGLQAWNASDTWRALSDDLVKRALELVLDSRQHPLLLVCASGVHETGAVVACLRRLQRWTATAVFDEYRRHAGTKGRISVEQFAELFDTDLVVLPPLEHRPRWLVEQHEAEAEEQRECRALRAAEIAEVAAARAAASSSSSSGGSAAAAIPSAPALPVSAPRLPAGATGTLFAAVRGPFRLPPPLRAHGAIASIYGSGEASASNQDEADAAEARRKKEKKERKRREAELAAANALNGNPTDASSVPPADASAKKAEEAPQVAPEPTPEPALPVPASVSLIPAYREWMYSVARSPLVSRAVVFSKKKSLVDDEDD